MPGLDHAFGGWEEAIDALPRTDRHLFHRRYGDAVNRALLERWLPRAQLAAILKTDLFEEAIGGGSTRSSPSGREGRALAPDERDDGARARRLHDRRSLLANIPTPNESAPSRPLSAAPLPLHVAHPPYDSAPIHAVLGLYSQSSFRPFRPRRAYGFTDTRSRRRSRRQDAPTRFELRLATTSREALDRLLPQILPPLHELFRGCELDVTHPERLEPEPGRKFRAFVPLGPGAAPSDL